MVSSGTKGRDFVWAFRICMTWYRQRWPPDDVEEEIYHSGIHFKPRFPPSFGITLANQVTSEMISSGTKRTALISAFGICMTCYRQRWPTQAVTEEDSHPSVIFKIQAAPYYSRIVTLFCDLKKSQKSVTIPSIEGKPRLELHSWMTVFLLYFIRGPFLPIPCHTYLESLDRSRSFGPWSDHITGQKIGKGNAKGGGKPGLDVHSWMIYFPLYCITGPSLPIPCHTYSESLDWSRSFDPHSDLIIGQKIGKGNAKGGGKPWVEVYSLMIDVLLYRIRGPSLPIPCHTHLESLGRSSSYGPCTDHDTCLKIGKDSARGGGVHWFEVYSWMINFLLHFIRGPSLPIPCQRLPINWHTGP